MMTKTFSSSVRFWHRRVETFIWATLLILCASGAMDIRSVSGETLSRSITLLYSNNINAEIDPCPV